MCIQNGESWQHRWMLPCGDFLKQEGVTLITELVGIKNLKTTGNYRLEFDVLEVDTHKVKELIDKLNKAFAMALVEYD